MEKLVRLNLGVIRGESRNSRAGKAISKAKEKVRKRTKKEDVRISNTLNEKIWARGVEKPPKSLEVQLVEKDDHVLVTVPESEEVVEGEEREETVEESEEESEEERKFDSIPEDVRDTLSEGTIGEGKDAVKEMNKADFELLLEFEKSHKNRKGMKKFLESNMR
ncbi:MAG: 60S ribosomal protein L31 [Candidatus Nanohaloarchaeota archaeon QJJ-9]|nr:60S ribosomal protein L31 [Candidatus Nanohaloarchaeota archaeon QJJ-9]